MRSPIEKKRTELLRESATIIGYRDRIGDRSAPDLGVVYIYTNSGSSDPLLHPLLKSELQSAGQIEAPESECMHVIGFAI